MRKLISMLLCVCMMITGFAPAEAAPMEKAEEAFTQWNPDAPALNALIEYVEDVTDPNSENFIPEEGRIATFDMDGTLMGELFPTYLEVCPLTHRILADPSWEPDEEMLEFGLMTRDHALDKSFPSDYDYEFSYHQAKAFAGMTLQEYSDFIARFLVHEVDGFEGMTYGEAYYLPMVEVVEYLQDNGFKCYIVSDSDRFIIRTYIDGMVDIPYENIIGSDTALSAQEQGETDGIEYVFTEDDTLVRKDELLVKDLKTNKVLQIAQEIGRQPVLSFGNSSGDASMNNYALYNNPYRSMAFMLVADDDVRDYGDPTKHDELTEKWQSMGYHVISMRDDWKTIYGEDVVKTGEFHWMEDYTDDWGLAEDTASTQYIGIISAMSNEVDLLLHETDIEHVDHVGGVDFNVGTLRGMPVVIAQAGVGKVSAAAGMASMLNRYDISMVVFTGIAGGVGDETRVLDVVIATTLVQHDYGQITNEGFEWTVPLDGGNGYYPCDEQLVALAAGSAKEVVGSEHVFLGVVASGDQFVASAPYVETLREKFSAIACEMEGASIASVCTKFDTPFVVIRTMSDKADGQAYETYENMGDIAADNSSRIIIQMLETLHSSSQSDGIYAVANEKRLNRR